MRPRGAIFVQWSRWLVAGARLIWNAAREKGNVVGKGLLVNKVEPMGDHKQSGPFCRKRCMASVDVNVIGPIHDRARIL